MEFIYSLTLGFENLKKFKNLALLNGVFWLLAWIGIGFVTWNDMTTFTARLLNFLPFSFIKSSGAFIIYSVLWLQAILVTIGIIFSLFNEFIKKNYFLTISIGGVVIAFWSGIFLFFEKEIVSYVEHLLTILPFNTIEELMSAFLAGLFYYMLFVATLSFSFFILSLKQLKNLAKEEYDVEIKNFAFANLSFIVVRDFLKFIVLVIIFYPMLLIPFLNFIFITWLFAYMVKDTLFHIVSVFDKKVSNKEIWTIAVLSTFLNFLPILNIFAPALGLLQSFYYTMEKEDEGI